jgi:transient receptor potential cation channel subfamily A member 1
MLAPHGCPRQTAILREIFNSPSGHGQSILLRHPLLETFLWLKWQRLRIFFFFILFIYGSFLASLSIFVIVDTETEGESITKEICRYVLIVTSAGLLFHIFIQALLRPLFYVREIETWIFAFCGSMALVIVFSSKTESRLLFV